MQYRIDERSGNKLSILGFGCMRFHRNVGGIDHKKAERLIMDAVRAGINYFDVAYLYPGSEAALGRVLRENGVRDSVYIATKLPIGSCGSGADFDVYFEKQLASLGTDYIDYYLMHNISSMAQWEELCVWGIREWIAEKKTKRQIRQIGFSFHGALDGFLDVISSYDWDFCQIQYNYANENYQAGVTGLKKAAKLRIPVIVMEPLLGGKLAGGLSPAAVSEFRKAVPGRTAAAWGLRWLWNQPEVTVVLSGMNEPDQLADNLRSADEAAAGMLTEAEIAAYGKVLDIFKSTDKIPCTGCAYCMPCPRGINIPACFASYNASYTHGRITGMTMYITSTAANRDSHAQASGCVQCGKCESHCPQKIEIRRSLKDVARRMEPFYFTLIMKLMRSRTKKRARRQERQGQA